MTVLLMLFLTKCQFVPIISVICCSSSSRWKSISDKDSRQIVWLWKKLLQQNQKIGQVHEENTRCTFKKLAATKKDIKARKNSQ